MRGKGKRMVQTMAVILCMLVVIMVAVRDGTEREENISPPEAVREEVRAVIKQKAVKKAVVKNPQTRIFTLYEVPLDEDFQIWLIGQCESHNVEYAVMVAMAEQESTFNPQAVGAEGELGMWQLKPATAAEAEEALGRRLNLFDPYDNAEAAIFLMEKYIEKYGNDTNALIVYNMGETGGRRCMESGTAKSKYAVSVMEKAESYKEKTYQIERVVDDV